MKVKPRKLAKEQAIEALDALYTAAGSLKGRAAMKLFLRDLLTPSERIMLRTPHRHCPETHRWQIVS